MERVRHVLGRIAVSTRPGPARLHATDSWERTGAGRAPTSIRRCARRSRRFAKLSHVEPGLQRLAADLDSREWERRHGALLDHDSLDLGYRVVVTTQALHHGGPGRVKLSVTAAA